MKLLVQQDSNSRFFDVVMFVQKLRKDVRFSLFLSKQNIFQCWAFHSTFFIFCHTFLNALNNKETQKRSRTRIFEFILKLMKHSNQI